MQAPVLTARERVLIAFVIVGVTVGIRFGVLVAIRTPMGDIRFLPATCIPSLVLLPWGLTIAERFHHCRSNGCRWRTGALVGVYACLCALFAVAIYLSLVLLDGESPNRDIATRYANGQGPWNLVLLFIGDGVGRAIHGYRAALLENERRHEADMAEANDARQAIERKTRPDTVIAMLETIAGRTLFDPAGARLLLMRLARHQRMLLTRPSLSSFEHELRIVRSTVALSRQDVRLAIGHCEPFPDSDLAEPWLRAVEKTLLEGPPGEYLVECDSRERSALLRLKSMDPDQVLLQFELPPATPHTNPPQPESSDEFSYSFGSSTFTAALVVYLLAAIPPYLGSLDSQPSWNVTVMTLASAVLWLVVGPAVYRITAVCVRLRLSIALLLSAASALSGAAAVTVASLGFLWLVTTGDEFMLTFLPLVASRNANVAFILCTSSFAEGFSRILIAARADAMRAQHETVHAEARELEARFHPHFLFNALASIAGLIRVNPGGAGEMCRLLARLVARTRAYAGIPSWTVRDEVTLVADYLAIQRRRFADRLRIANWEVAPSAMDVAIPRLSLQPLIENIFIHAVAASYGVISIGLSIGQRGRMLAVELWNDTAEGPPTPGYGRGVAFVSNRVHDAGGRMLVVPSVDRFTVHLTIPIRKPSIYPMNRPTTQRA